MKTVKNLFVLGISFLLLPLAVQGSILDYEEQHWRIIPSFWIAGFNAEITQSGSESDVDSGFSELSADNNLGAGLQAEWRPARWGLMVAGDYLQYDPTVKDGANKVNSNLDVGLIEVAGIYHFGDEELYSDTIFGIRNNNFDSKVEIEAANGSKTTSSESKNWTDIMVGARMGTSIGENWSFGARVDFGGFGLESDLAMNLLGYFGLYPWQNTSFLFGYRYFSLNYSEGSSQDRWKFKGSMYGPFLGLGFHW